MSKLEVKCGDVKGEFPWRCVCITGIPSKLAFFVWTTALDGTLTIDNLNRRHHILINWYCMCCRDAESVNHLLVHCRWLPDFGHLIFLCLEWRGFSQRG